MVEEFMYLDHAAATPVDPLVLEAMLPFFSDKFYNPSSPYSKAVEVKRDYQDAKSSIARSLGVKADELVMTAGATESINIALSAIGGGEMAVGAIEHPSVLNRARLDGGIIIPADNKGQITAEAVAKVLHPGITLISVGLVNGELGTIQSIDEIIQVVERERRRRQEAGDILPLYLHCDASQALALMDVKPKRLGVDMLTLSAAKVYGPKQVGLLWVRTGVELMPTVVGGGQESGLRGGTENVAGVIGFAKAVELVSQRRHGEAKRLRTLRDDMQQALTDQFPEAVVSSNERRGLASFLNISFPGVDAERLVYLLEAKGVMVGTGSACAANKGRRSHVLKAIGLSDELIDGSLRITLGRLSTTDNIRQSTNLIIEAVSSEYERLGR